MGYTSWFNGEINVSPPLNEHEISYLSDFSLSRRMNRRNGPLYANPGEDPWGSSPDEGDVIDHNRPPDGQPGLWCQWVPAVDGSAIVWDEGEKFYHSAEWMAYLIDHLLSPAAQPFVTAHMTEDVRLQHFTCDHLLNGRIFVEGEDGDDRWILVVENNAVGVATAVLTYGEPVPIADLQAIDTATGKPAGYPF